MTAETREAAVRLYREGLARVSPATLLRRALRVTPQALHLHFGEEAGHVVPLAPGGRVVLVAVGKAAAPMAVAAHERLGGRIARGIVVTKDGFTLDECPFPQHESAHPVPDERGVAAAQAVLALLQGLDERDVVLALISGGASALLPAPVAGVTLADKQRLIGAMLRTDMDIHAINRVRKALSRLKGGGLAAAAAPAQVVGLYLSDVAGDRLASIGSGPTVPEPVDPAAARDLLRRKGLWESTPPAIRDYLEREAPPPRRPAREPVNGIIGSNRHLRHAVAEAAREAGFAAHVVDDPLTGLAADAMPLLLQHWQAFRDQRTAEERLCLVCGGETTVEVQGNGLGGRCQELAARMMPRLAPDTVFLAAGSDGNDGPTDAAGGVVDAQGWQQVQARGVPYEALLADNDSYHLLARIDRLIRVPPTRNNLMDVYVFLREGAKQ